MPISTQLHISISRSHLGVEVAVVRCEDNHGVVKDVLTPQLLQDGPARGVYLRGFCSSGGGGGLANEAYHNIITSDE